MKPVARTDRLIRQVVGQETLVYDPADDTACCLNPLATLVWRQCDGTHSVDEIAATVQHELSLVDSVEAEEAVWRVIDELEKHHLLQPVKASEKQVPRRDVLKALALLPLFPAIQQITAPSFASGGSPAPSPTPSGSSVVVSQSVTPTMTGTAGFVSQSVTPSMTGSAVVLSQSVTPSITGTAGFVSQSVTPSHSHTPSVTPTMGLTQTPTPSVSMTPSSSVTPSPTPTHS
jgi:hypothetical protein